MLTLKTMTATQQIRLHVPAEGPDKDGVMRPLEGDPVVTLETGAEFVTVTPDPADGSGLTLLVKGVADGLYAGKIERDARIGTEVSLVSGSFAGQVGSPDAEAVSFELTADEPEEQNSAGFGRTAPRAPANAPQRRPDRR